MDSFLKMDIFFVVATLATAIVGSLSAVALWYLIRVLRAVDELSHEVTDEAKAIRGDIQEARETLREGGGKLAKLVGLTKHTKRTKRTTT